MQFKKNLKFIFTVLATLAVASNAKSAEECFEGASRLIFKFNMAVDEVVLEPLAKGYNKLPSPIKQEQAILPLTLVLYCLFQIIFYKEI